MYAVQEVAKPNVTKQGSKQQIQLYLSTIFINNLLDINKLREKMFINSLFV